ncbi:unnamed protein product [Caenorhabditis brenneri]
MSDGYIVELPEDHPESSDNDYSDEEYVYLSDTESSDTHGSYVVHELNEMVELDEPYHQKRVRHVPFYSHETEFREERRRNKSLLSVQLPIFVVEARGE